jgi:hypothetical protein
MPAQASIENTTQTPQGRLNAISDKLMRADGVIAALLNSFDEQTGEALVPHDKMLGALFALSDLVGQARKLAC